MVPRALQQHLDWLLARESTESSYRRACRASAVAAVTPAQERQSASPSRSRLPLRTKASQRRRSIRLCKRRADPGFSPRRPSSWAGMTRVSLKTSTSSRRSATDGRSRTRSDRLKGVFSIYHPASRAASRGRDRAQGYAFGGKLEIEQINAHDAGLGKCEA